MINAWNRPTIGARVVHPGDVAKSMIPKSGYRFSEKIMLKQRARAG
jgi:hypothetical protein